MKFSPDEQRLYDLACRNFKPREYLKPLNVGQWETARRGDQIFNEVDLITQIVVPTGGRVSAIQGGEDIVTLDQGELLEACIALTNQRSAFEA